MKTAEDFCRDLGETEEIFRACILQTLAELECKEDEPVKKKISMGMVLVMAVVLLTVTAVADGQWGILSFLRDRGKPADGDQLLSVRAVARPDTYGEHDLVDAVMTEALYEDGTLYLAVTLTPLKEKTMVVPAPQTNIERTHRYTGRLLNNSRNSTDLSSISMQDAMKDAAYGDVSVLDYAQYHGFDQVVLIDSYSVEMYSTAAFWSQDEYDGLQYAEYRLSEDGTLRIILQTGYRPNLSFADTRMESASMSMCLWAFDVRSGGQWLQESSAAASAYFAIPQDPARLSSIPEDAHDIVGYIGAVEFISIAPYDAEYMAITIQLNLRDDRTEDTWMTGPAWVILDAEGNRLCTVDESRFVSVSTVKDTNGDRRVITHGLFPVSCMPEGRQITLQAENWRNYNIVYDVYTYTLTEDHAPAGDLPE